MITKKTIIIITIIIIIKSVNLKKDVPKITKFQYMVMNIVTIKIKEGAARIMSNILSSFSKKMLMRALHRYT
jgi:hypothetical protein